MRQTTTQTSASTVTHSYRAEVPFTTRPEIKEATWIDGIKHYIGVNGKLYESSAFDRFFSPLRLPVLTRSQLRARMIRAKQRFEL